jgi:acyl-CoA synthetase (AMP-forming)/AMP-acid ligase II
MPIGDFLVRTARVRPEAIALVWGDERTTWSGLDAAVNRAANALIGVGVGAGDRVLVALENRPEFVQVFFAIAKIGAVAVPIPENSVESECVHFLADCAPRAVVVSQTSRAALLGATRTTQVDAVIDVDLDEHQGESLSLSRLTGSAEDREPTADIDPDGLCMIKYSSGTTGRPKGCCISHRSMDGAVTNLLNHVPFIADDRLSLSSPLSMGLGIWLLLGYAAAGATTYLLPRFDPEELLSLIRRERLTGSYAILSTFTQLLAAAEQGEHDLSSLRHFVGAPGPAADPIGSMRRLSNLPGFTAAMYNGWGSSEAVGFVTYLLPEDIRAALSDESLAQHIASVGREAIGCRIEIVDESGSVLPDGATGEMVIRSGYPFSGYWGQPEATQAVFDHGWLRSGDLAYKDEEGFIQLAGREKDMVKTGGMNVYPAEVEQVLSSHPAVLEAAVFGVPDQRWGEKVIACIVVRSEISGEDVRLFAREHLSGYKVPKAIHVLDDLPRNDTGKIVKRELRDLFMAAEGIG